MKEEEEERREKEGSREENIRGIHSAVAAAVWIWCDNGRM